MDTRGASSLVDDPRGELERLQEASGTQFEHLNRAAEYTTTQLREKSAALAGGGLAADTTVVVFGSWARNELTDGSDDDWAVLVGREFADDDRDVVHAMALAQQNLGADDKKLGSQQVFGVPFDVHGLVDHIGLDDDTTRNSPAGCCCSSSRARSPATSMRFGQLPAVSHPARHPACPARRPGRADESSPHLRPYSHRSRGLAPENPASPVNGRERPNPATSGAVTPAPLPEADALARAHADWNVYGGGYLAVFRNGQCTDWAAQKRPDLVERATVRLWADHLMGLPDLGISWNGGSWDDMARAARMAVGTVPRAGSVVTVDPGVLGTSAATGTSRT